MHRQLHSVIAKSGIWAGDREKTHRFLLSPSVYTITEAQQKELTLLGYALFDSLEALSHIASIAYGPHFQLRAWTKVRRVLSSGVPLVYKELQATRPEDIPRLLKVDLMVDESGNFRIAEIDGHNKHGLGYSTLGKRFRDALYPEAIGLPGVVKALAAEVQRLGFTTIKLFYADRERFYLPEFQIAQTELRHHGVDCLLFSESEATEVMLQDGLFLDLPFLYTRTTLYETIIPAYLAGRVRFIIPPKPFMGAKGVLALLRNDEGDDHLEAILRSFTRKTTLDLLRNYIPETLLVGKKAAKKKVVEGRVSQKRYVLKESISSGMKGTVFSDCSTFPETLDEASRSRMNWILQEEVLNQPQTFSWFNPGETTLQTANNWLMRVTVHYVNRQLGDIVVTARQDKAVHGAKDCLQIGSIIQ